METIDIELWEEDKIPFYNPEYGGKPAIHIYPAPGEKKRGCVVICAGGAYRGRAWHEDKGYAEEFVKYGITAVVVDYRVYPYTYPAPQEDLARAVRYMRKNADRYNILPDKIAICGSSAGGHLVTCGMEHFGVKEEGDEIDRVSSRPDAAILCYAVSTLGEYTHEDTMQIITHGDAELRKKLSGELNVPDDCPPVFMWHTAEDGSVPVENALIMGMALRKKKIPFELHVYPYGAHGLGLVYDDALDEVRSWFPLCVRFLEKHGF